MGANLRSGSQKQHDPGESHIEYRDGDACDYEASRPTRASGMKEKLIHCFLLRAIRRGSMLIDFLSSLEQGDAMRPNYGAP